jgi:hypothetical protein
MVSSSLDDPEPMLIDAIEVEVVDVMDVHLQVYLCFRWFALRLTNQVLGQGFCGAWSHGMTMI